MKYLIATMATLYISLTVSHASFRRVEGLGPLDLRHVVTLTSSPLRIATASDNTLYIGSPKEGLFRAHVVLTDETIRSLYPDPQQTGVLYLAGSRHGYRVTDDRQRIFSVQEGAELHQLMAHGDRLYAATSDGRYAADAQRLDWKRVPAIRNQPIYQLTGYGQSLYITCDEGVYRLREDGRVSRIYYSRRNGGEGHAPQPVFVHPDALTPGRLWLGTTHGLYLTEDHGTEWKRLNASGAERAHARCMVQPPLQPLAYICTDSGFLQLDTESGDTRWIYENLPTSQIYWADTDEAGALYLATARGLYTSLELRPETVTDTPLTESIDPPIRAMQEAAMRYNEVHPDKIDAWRTRLKYRALMPRISLDYDKTIGYSVSGNGKYFGVGPYDWGITLSWDMGNLLWNSYEDDIDNRSRLTTQLRMDILDEVNRLYYERIRMRQELSSDDLPPDQRHARELRLLELNAALDAYTGGYLTRWLK